MSLKVSQCDLQIRSESRKLDYNTVDYKVEDLIENFADVSYLISWDTNQQSRFIESLILELPTRSSLFILKGALPLVVDGRQRIMALVQFCNNDLALHNLTQLSELNGFYFGDLTDERQKWFKRRLIRTVYFLKRFQDSEIEDLRKRLNDYEKQSLLS